MINNLDYSIYQIGTFYKTNGGKLGEALMRLSTGKRVNKPSDDIAGFLRSESLSQRYNSYEKLKPDLVEWSGAVSTAETAATTVLDNLYRMQELIDLYKGSGATADEKLAYTTEYDLLQSNVARTISNTTYRSQDLLNQAAKIATVTLTPEGDSMDIILGVATVASALDPAGVLTIDTVETAVDDAIGDMHVYLATVSGYKRALDSQSDIIDSAMQNTASAQSTITDIDQAQEIINVTNMSIQQQASIAMMAQGNLSRQSILGLYQFHT